MQPKPTCYPDGISYSKQADDSCGIHFNHRSNRKISVFTYEPIHYGYLNPFLVRYVGMENISMDKR